MQPSFHVDEPDFRAADVAGHSMSQRRAGDSGESLEALKARTTPMDITNPFVTPHASCELAFLATAISIEHRYDEVHMHLPAASHTPATLPLQAADNVVSAAEVPVLPVALPAIKTETVPEGYAISAVPVPVVNPLLPQFWLPQPLLPPATLVKIGVTAFKTAQPAALLPNDSVSDIKAPAALHARYDDDYKPAMFSGKAPAGKLLQFYIDGILVGSIEIDESGDWQFEQPAGLGGAQHTFSAILVDEEGVIGEQLDLPFTSLPWLDSTLLPPDESELVRIELALIELTLPQEDTVPAISPLPLTNEILTDWQTQAGISVTTPLTGMDLLMWDECADGPVVWH